jgi:hypothetical protein
MGSKSSSLKHAILAARDVRVRPVDVPEWPGVAVFVKSLNVREAIAFEAAQKVVAPEKVVSLYLAYTLCDGDGAAAFDPETDVDALCEKDPDVLTRIFREALSLNASDEAADKAREGESSPGRSS